MKRLMQWALVAMAALVPLGHAWADDATGTSMTPYLGVSIQAVPPAVAMQLPGTLPADQGVQVFSVEPDSPAAKAGVQPYDILLSYGDQRLYSPEQLAKLVRADQAGNEVTLKLIRQGHTAEVSVTLGEHQRTAPAGPSGPSPGMPGMRSMPHPWQMTPDNRWGPHHQQTPFSYTPPGSRAYQGNVMESFNSLSMSRKADGTYNVSVEYLGQDGTKVHREYQGSRDEIRGQIQQEKDLPAVEKQQLLRALDLGPQAMTPAFPDIGEWMRSFGMQPFGTPSLGPQRPGWF